MARVCRRATDGRIECDPSFSYPEDINDAVRSYYRAVHKHYGVRNVGDHIVVRLREETVECERLAKHESLLHRRFEGGRALVVGLGSGGLAICLHALADEVHGVEPDPVALRISQKKMSFVGGEKARFLPATAESLPYRSDTFDHIFCFTVLEHVRDVNASLREMVRVLRPSGVLVLNTPDYRFPFEGHYKVPLPLKPLPRLLSAAILRLVGKPTRPLLREINYVTSKQIQHLLMSMPNLRFFRVFASYPAIWRKRYVGLGFKERCIYAMFRFWARKLEIYQNLEYYVFKSSELAVAGSLPPRPETSGTEPLA